MKKIIGITLLLGLTLATSVNAQKIGHIAFDSLVRSMPEFDSARKSSQLYYQQLEMQVESMQKEFQEKYQQFQQDLPKMTELIKQTKQDELQQLQQRIQNFQQQAQGSLQRFQDSLQRPIVNKAKSAVSAVAKEHAYKYILDTSLGAVLYSEDVDDVFGLVAEKLGIKSKGAGSKGK